MTLIFERSQEGRRATSQSTLSGHDATDILHNSVVKIGCVARNYLS